MNFLCLKPSRTECLPTQTTTKKYASKPSKFKMRHLKFSNVQRCFEKGVLIFPTAVNCDQIMGKGSTTLYHGRDEKLP